MMRTNHTVRVMPAMGLALALSLSAVPSAHADPVAPPAVPTAVASGIAYPGQAPGVATATAAEQQFTLSNAVIAATYDFTSGQPLLAVVLNKETGQAVPLQSSPVLRFSLGGTEYDLTGATVVDQPRIVDLAATADSPTLALRHAGKALTATYRVDAGAAGQVDVTLQAELRDEANYVRQVVKIAPAGETPLPITAFTVLDAPATAAAVEGRDAGYPITFGEEGARTAWIGLENPMASASVEGGRAVLFLERAGHVRKAEPVELATTVGVNVAGQQRRAFAYYLERERPHFRRTFLHYQSWFDLKPGDAGTDVLTMPAAELTSAIDLFGTQFTSRGAQLDSYWIDDGWDYLRDPRVSDESDLHVWDFDPGQFGDGFAAQRAVAEKHGGSLSVWMSPFGGYGTSAARRQALNASKEGDQVLETYGGRQFKLSGEKYFSHFRSQVFNMMDNHNVQGFKFDGIGGGLYQTVPAATYRADYEAMFRLARDMRAHRSDVFINTTVGTWGSPYWMWHSDSIWRDGHDAAKAGEGPDQELYVSYRDGEVYQNFVVEAPLVPITKLMNHGFIFSNRAPQFAANHDLARPETRRALAADMRNYFAMGLELQELYVRNTLVDPARIGEENADWFWDELTRNAKWARANEALLADVHWVGGDPRAAEVYGTAAWSNATGSEQAMLMVRNPAARPQHFAFAPGEAFELPAGAHGTYRCVERDGQAEPFVAGQAHPYYVTLEPFQVKLFECAPSTDAPTDSAEPEYSPEFNKLPKNGWQIVASSEETQGEPGQASRAIDDNASTIWHSRYTRPTTGPHWLQVDMQLANEVWRLGYTPRPGGGGNGRFKDFELLVSADGTEWRTAVVGQFPNSESTQFLTLPEELRTFRHFKLVGKNTHNGRDFGAVAELTAYGVAGEDPFLDRTGWQASADSEETQGEAGQASRAIDGSVGTFWHTAYHPSIDPLPHTLTLDMQYVASVDGLRYLPRQDEGTNGVIQDYRIEVSADGDAWQVAHEGQFTDKNVALVTFDPVTARYVRLVALSAQNGGQFAGAAEVDVQGQYLFLTPPAQLEIDDQPGTGADSFLIPELPGIRFLSNGNDIAAGKHVVPAGTESVLIQAAPQPGYRFVPQAKTDYQLTFSTAGSNVTHTRLAGRDRVDTAIAAAQDGGYTPGTALLATGNSHVDAMAAGPLAGALDAPIYFSTSPDFLEVKVLEAMRAAQVQKVYIVGGEHSVPVAKELALNYAGIETVRVAGQNRYTTAQAVVAETSKVRGKEPQAFFIASGSSYADTLGAGVAAGRSGGVVILAGDGTLPSASQAMLAQAPHVPVVLVGGPAAQVRQHPALAGREVTTVVGANRFETMSKLHAAYAADATKLVVATGFGFADALAAGSRALADDGALLLVEPTRVPPATAQALAGGKFRKLEILGGRASVHDEVAQALHAALQN